MNELQDKLSRMSVTKLAYAAKKLESKRKVLQTEPIAIVGMACRLPGHINSVADYWQQLLNGVDCISKVPMSRWDNKKYYDPDASVPGKINTQYGGFVDDVDQFDSSFFGIAPVETKYLDPQQRLLLELSWNALESANIIPEQLFNSNTGVFVGIAASDYGNLLIKNQEPEDITAYFGTGSALSVASGRLAYVLGLTGPCMSVDTACSSSLVSVHLACQSLRLRESDIALAAGVNLLLTPEPSINFSQANMLSADGHCKTFDDEADGYVRGEGCGVVVLKRLSDAISHQDNIVAVIRGSAVNQDGPSGGLTVPNGPSQKRMFKHVLASSGVDPAQMGYIEAHGTGTPLGDPIEIESLGDIFKQSHSKESPLYVGSAKTNIGHLEAAAGIAGLIKACLCLEQETIAPHLHFKTPNTHVDWDSLPIKIPTEITPWKRGAKRRLAGVSSFGFSGTNAHIILEEAPVIDAVRSTTTERDYHLLCLTAKTEQALKCQAQEYRDYFLSLAESVNSLEEGSINTNSDSNSHSRIIDSSNNHSNYHAGNISYTSHVGRSHFNYRLSLIGNKVSDWAAQLNDYINTGQNEGQHNVHNSGNNISQSSLNVISGEVENCTVKIGFLYTGQGSQYPDMCRNLYDSEVVFRDSLHASAELLKELLPLPLIEVIYGKHQAVLNQTEYTQPALFAIEIALSTLWNSWGIEPDYVLGHSLGEYVAACVSGVMSIKDGLTLVTTRGRLMQALPMKGGMLSVLGNESTIKAVIAESINNYHVEISAYNAPGNLVLSGQVAALAQVAELLIEAGIKTQMLNVSTGFHSSLVEPMLKDFDQAISKIELKKPAKGYISALSGKVANEEVTQAEYWTRHIREAVNFRAGVETLQQAGAAILIEIGPSPILTGLAQQTIDDIVDSEQDTKHTSLRSAQTTYQTATISCLASIRKQFNNHQTLYKSLAALYTQGVAVDWQAVDQGYNRCKVNLPTYAFQRQRYWLHSNNVKEKEAAHSNYFYALEWKENTPVIADQHSKDELIGRPNESAVDSTSTAGIYVIFIDNNSIDNNDTDNKGMATRYSHYLRKTHAQVITVQKANCFSKLAEDRYTINPDVSDDYLKLFTPDNIDFSRVVKIVHFWNIDNPKSQVKLTSDISQTKPGEIELSKYALKPANLKDTYQTGLYSLVNLLQACVQQNQHSHAKLWIITQNAVATGINNQNLSLHQTPVAGFAKALVFEHQDLFGGTIDISTVQADTNVDSVISSNLNTDTDINTKIESFYQHIEQGLPGFYAYRNDKFLSQRLVRCPVIQAGEKQTIKKDSVYVISGGLGQLGLTIMEWLVSKGAKFIALISRSEETEEVTNRLKKFRQDTEITSYIADLSKQSECNSVFDSIKQSNKRMAGVFHAAGSLHDSLIINQCWDNFVKPLDVKITGTENLFNVIKDQSIDFLYLFSSISSVLAAPGQANYSAANAFMDGFSHYAKSHAVPSLSIHWGAWSEVGMAAEAIDKGYSMPGIEGMSNQNALAALNDIMENQFHHRESELVVCDFNWKELTEMFSTNNALSVLSEQMTIVPSVKNLLNSLLKQNQENREGMLASYLTESLMSISQISDSVHFEKQHVLDLGMDSLMIMELIQRVRKDLDIQLYPKEIYEHPQVSDLIAYLQEVFERKYFTNSSPERSLTQSQTTSREISIETAADNSSAGDANVDVHKLDLTDADDPSLIKVPDMAMILSSPRAGSTLLRVMLGGHQDLFSPPELHLMLFSNLAHWSEQLKHSDFDQGLQRALMELNNIDATQSKILLQEWVQQKLSIAEVYQRLSSLSTKKLLIDKSPTYAMYPEIFDRAERLFEQGKYIHLVRHPYSVIDSFVKLRMDKLLPYKTSDPYKTAEQIWLRSNKNVMKFFDRLPKHRKHFIKYEDVVVNPQKTMQALCEFLQIPYDKAILSPYEKGRMSGGIYNESTSIGDPNFLTHKTIDASLADKWKSINLPINLSDEAAALSDYYEYELSDTKSAKAATSVVESCDINMREETVEINGLDFCLCRWGNTQDPMVVMLHGILEQGAVWDEVAKTLVSKHYQVVAPDMRGQGKSQHVGPGGSYHINDFIADLQLLMEYLNHDKPVLLVGHSFGSVVAALYASINNNAKNKINKLILVETLLFQETVENDPVKVMRTSIDYMLRSEKHTVFATVLDAEKRFRELIPAISEDLAHTLVARILVNAEQGFVWRWDKKLQSRSAVAKPGNGTIDEYLKMINEIDIPVSLIYGQTSQYYKSEDSDRLMSALTSADKHVISGGHYLPIDSPQQLADCIVSSLKKEW